MSKRIIILLTGVGAPGTQGTIYALRALNAVIIGTDVDPQAVGKYLCDDFYTLPLAINEEAYLSRLKSLCLSKHVNVIVPQNTAELLLLATNREVLTGLGVQVLISKYSAIEQANNKYKLLQLARELGIPTGTFSLCGDFESLSRAYYERREKGLLTVVKPPCGNGSRGVRVLIDEDRDRKLDFYTQKPSSLYCTLNELHSIIGDDFPELLIMDYLDGDEYTIDVLRTENQFIALPRKREIVRSGITFRASMEKNEEIIEACRKLSEAMDLQYCFGFQFKKNNDGVPVLLECNPRVQGSMVMSVIAGANIIAEAVRCLVAEKSQPIINIDWHTRFIRYWGAISVNDAGVVKI